MKRLVGSPYMWIIVAVVAVVAYAYVARDRYRQAAVLPGAQAPDFAFSSLAHGDVSLSDYEDHVVLVNVWATWCAPCKEEMPAMQRLHDAFEGEDFEILAVSVDAVLGLRDTFGQEGGDLAAFANEYDLSFPILHDPSGTMRQSYQVSRVPESFIVAKGGLIWKKIAGATEWDHPVNQELIRRLLEN
jgi:thiol-disulfide isomerase/thioredoxin